MPLSRMQLELQLQQLEHSSALEGNQGLWHLTWVALGAGWRGNEIALFELAGFCLLIGVH